VDRVINEVKGNKDLEITEFTVTGHASPEGNFESNRASPTVVPTRLPTT